MNKRSRSTDLCSPPQAVYGFDRVLILFSLLALWTLPAMAEPQTTTTPSTELTSSKEESWNFPLKEFRPEQGPIALRTTAATQDVSLQLSDRLVLTGAELNLTFSNSISLLRERSQLRILLNGITVAQLPLDRDKPRVEGVTIALPHDLLSPGFNRLTFMVAQHYTFDCEDPASAELWTEIDTSKTSLAFKGNLQTINPTLADLDSLMGPAIGNPWRYRLLLPPKHGEDHLNAAALTAEAIGLRLGYRPALFLPGSTDQLTQLPTGSPSSEPWGELRQEGPSGADTLLVGTREELKDNLSEQVTSQINGAFLGVYSLTSDPRYLLLVVSGTTHEEVKRAALALGFFTFPFTDVPFTHIKDLKLPARTTYGTKRLVATGQSYRFSDLGFKTTTSFGGGYHANNLAFDLPPDFYVPEDENTRIGLNFVYDAKMRRDSVLNIYINGIFERAIALKNSEGDKFKGYEIFVPLRSFRPGPNVIRFEPVLVSLVHGECEMLQEENLRFTLFDTSVIEFPQATRYTMQPNLQLFAETSFPYFYTTEDEPAGVAVLSDDPATLAATWTLLAKLAQVADTPLYNMKITSALPQKEQSLIVVSPMEKIDAKLFPGMPIFKDGVTSYPYPVGVIPNAEPTTQGFWDSILPRSEARDETSLSLSEPTSVRMGQTGLPQTHGMITAFQSPFAKDHTVTLITAASADNLWERMGAIVAPELWSQLKADTVLWTKPGQPVASQRAGNPFYIGNPNVNELARYHFSRNPFVWVAGMFLLIVLWAWLTYVLLKRRFKKRHGRGITVED